MSGKMCRLCFGTVGRLFGIFGKKGKRLKVAKLIQLHFFDELSEDDILPNHICGDCWLKLAKFHAFFNAVDEAKNVFLKNTVKEEAPNFIAINCDAIDFEDDLPAVKIEPIEVENMKSEEEKPEELKSEVPNEKSKSESTPHARESVDNVQNDFFDSGNYVDSESSEDDDDDDDDRDPDYKEESKVFARIQKIENLPATANKAIIKSRSKTKKKSITIKAKSKSDTKSEGNSGPKSIVSETDFQLATKYMRINCELCDHPFESLISARTHSRTEHNSTAKFVCCKRRLRVYNINDHLQYHLDPDIYKCNLCEKRLVLSAELKAHLQSHMPKQFECDICKKRFASRCIIRAHIMNCHACEKQRFECHICQKRFDLKTRLDIHIRMVHERQEQQVCHICAKVYMSTVGLKRHLEEHSGVEKPRVNCEKCGDSFKHLRNLKRHMKKHNEAGKIFQCPHCAKLSPSRAALGVHIASVHSKPMLECHLCDKKFKRTLALTEHVATHTGEDLYSCNYCPQKFKYHSSLYLHYRGVHPVEWQADRKTKPKRNMKTTAGGAQSRKPAVETLPYNWNPQFYAQ